MANNCSNPERADELKAQPPQKQARVTRRHLAAGVGIAASCALLCTASFCGIAGFMQDSQIKSAQEQRAIAQEAREAQHIHTLEVVSETVHHDAVVKEVVHPATYLVETSMETVCNVCEDGQGNPLVISGRAAAHQADTGHGYTTSTPVSQQKLSSSSYTEPVVVSEAYDEVVPVYQICTTCGTRIPLEAGAAGNSAAVASNSAETDPS